MERTSYWEILAEGPWARENLHTLSAGRHTFPREVEERISGTWRDSLEKRMEALIAGGTSRADLVIKPDQEGALILYQQDGETGNLIPRMWPGPLLRLDGYEFTWKGITLTQSPTRYDEMLGTNNANPFELLDQYGTAALSNAYAKSIVVTFLGENGNRRFFTFDRSENLGEYASRPGHTWHHIVGGHGTKVSDHPLDAVIREMYQELRVLPNVSQDELIQNGILPENTSIEEGQLKNGQIIYLVRQRDNVDAPVYLSEGWPVATGLVLNVQPDDLTSHFKPEVCFTYHTNVPEHSIEGVWRRGREHTGIHFADFTPEGLAQVLIEQYANFVPPGHAALFLAGKQSFGPKWAGHVVDEINRLQPIADDHPHYSRPEFSLALNGARG